VETYSSVYDAGSSCLTSTYEQNKNNNFSISLYCKKINSLYFFSVITYMLFIIFKCKKSITLRNMPCCVLITVNPSGFGDICRLCNIDSSLIRIPNLKCFAVSLKVDFCRLLCKKQ